MRHMVWSILLLTLLCGICSAATLSIEPAESTCMKGETVDLTVRVQDVSNLGGFDIDVTWKPSVVILGPEPGNVTIGPLFSGNVNHSAVYTQSGRIRVAAVNASLAGVSGNAHLFTVRLKAVDDTGASTPVSIRVNNHGFLNSTSGGNITVSAVTNATIKTVVSSVIDARITTSSNQMLVNQKNLIIASVVNRRGIDTSPLTVNVSIIDGTKTVVFQNITSDVIIPGWGKFQRDIEWAPTKNGTYTAIVNVTSDKPLTGTNTDAKVITAKEYTLEFNSPIYGPWDERASIGSWFYMYAYVKASQSGNVWFNITTPDHVNVNGAKNRTQYLSASDWNYVGAWMWSDTPGRINAGDIRFDIAANDKAKSQGGPGVLIWVPSIRVSSANATIANNGQDGELTFNTLHTNYTYDNVTKIVIQSGAQGRTLSGLEYLVGYPYGCVEQTTSRMLASLNVKNYYINRDRPADWDGIRKNVNDSVEAGVKKLLVGGEVGQSPNDGGWSLWGPYYRSESSSSSYASYTLARINDKDEDLNRLLAGKIANGTNSTKETVNFERVIKWFHDNPDDRRSGTWSWSAPVCHAWVPESNTAFVMLIHDMINRTVELDEEHRGYMEDNMKNATRYLVGKEKDQKWPTGEDTAMARALALWGLEAFAMPSDDVSSEDINATKAALAEWLITNQKDDGSWPADSYYGWYYGGRQTEATAYGVLALNATGIPADNMTILNGVNWLTRQYSAGGGWGYTWASQVAIDALIQCQPVVVTETDVTIEIDDNLIGIFPVNRTHPRVEYTLTEEQMNTLMRGGNFVRHIEGSGGHGEVKKHTLTATCDDGPILVSVDHSQSAPIREIDGKIMNSRLIQSFGYEEEDGPLHVSTDIGILSDAPLVQEIGNTYDVDITAAQMVAGVEADVTITVKSLEANVTGPMIEIPIAGFAFDNTTGITENGEEGAFEYLNGTTGNEHPSLFIQSVGWVKNTLMTYKFKITPEDHGALDLDLRIRPLYDDTNVYQVNKTFTVMGRGNVSVNVVDENGAAFEAESIALGTITVNSKSSHTFTSVLEGNYTLFVNGTGGYPSIRTAARVTPDATALCNITLPSSLLSPTLIFSEGGAGSIASVAQVEPEQLNAARSEATTYNVTVLGDGGEVGIALEFPMRYLMNNPVVRVNGVEAEYELINGTFEYNPTTRTYSTTNATLVVYNTTAGSNVVEIELEGGKLGKARRTGEVTSTDAMFILQFVVGSKTGFDTYDYVDVHSRDKQTITSSDAMFILQKVTGSRDEYYNLKP